jgi:hypothetical protein
VHTSQCVCTVQTPHVTKWLEVRFQHGQLCVCLTTSLGDAQSDNISILQYLFILKIYSSIVVPHREENSMVTVNEVKGEEKRCMGGAIYNLYDEMRAAV